MPSSSAFSSADPPASKADGIAEACRWLEDLDPPPNLRTLAQAAGLSLGHFQKRFKQVMGLTPKAYAQGVRRQRLTQALSRCDSVTEAFYEAGYNASSRFYAEATTVLGMAPRRYRQGGKGETIRFAVGQCSLGAILVAATERGVCAIQLGDDPDVLARDLQDRFPQADLRGGEAAFETWVARAIGLIEAPQRGSDLPLDVRGTAFQQRVWQALRAIPIGQTVSYAELAARIGAPTAVRAVASACAANPLAVAIPCHRVLRQDGHLSGYRWGVERKRTLLAREGVTPS